MLAELLLVQARGLFLQLVLGDAVAQRLQAALGGQALVVVLAQLRRQRVQLGAGELELFFLHCTPLQRILQAGVGGLLVDGFQLDAGVFQRLRKTLRLVAGGLDIAAQLVDAVSQVALGKQGFLRRALEVAQLVPCR